MMGLSFLVGFAVYSVPGAVAASIDMGGILLCAGKTFGRRLGMRSSFWRTPLTAGEWIVVILTVLYVNLVAFTPEVMSIGVRRQPG
jgi:hypothetical protein